jgi:hypothetical protein
MAHSGDGAREAADSCSSVKLLCTHRAIGDDALLKQVRLTMQIARRCFTGTGAVFVKETSQQLGTPSAQEHQFLVSSDHNKHRCNQRHHATVWGTGPPCQLLYRLGNIPKKCNAKHAY